MKIISNVRFVFMKEILQQYGSNKIIINEHRTFELM